MSFIPSPAGRVSSNPERDSKGKRVPAFQPGIISSTYYGVFQATCVKALVNRVVIKSRGPGIFPGY